MQRGYVGECIISFILQSILGRNAQKQKTSKPRSYSRKTIALADDLLTQCNNKQHTEQIIGELEELQVQGLHLNKNKSVIIGDYNEIKPNMFFISNI
jgi:hypothetical protein